MIARFICAGVIASAAFAASAEIVDITAAGSRGELGGALFVQWNGNPTGTGIIDSFVQVTGNADVVHAYNTTANGTLDNGSSDNFNHELLLSEIPSVTIDGVEYLEFLLDINQEASDPLLSLDELQIFTADTPNQSVENFNSGIVNLADSTLIYDLDAAEDSYILLDYSLNGGSGNGDMLLYVEADLFDTGQTYVYLYSLFGENHNANAGFEEWAVQETTSSEVVIPEPAGVALLGFGLLTIAWRGRRVSRSVC